MAAAPAGCGPERDLSHTPPRRGVPSPREGQGPPVPPPSRHAALVLALLLPVLLAPVAQGALSRETWESGDAARIRREAAGDPSGELLAATLTERDPDRTAAGLRRLAGLPAPDWMRAEALRGLCQVFCLLELPDSLRHSSAQLATLTGHSFDCPLLDAITDRETGPEAIASAGGWCLQVGAFSTERAARAALKALGKDSAGGRVDRENGLWKARIPCASRAEAERLGKRLKAAGKVEAYRVVEAAP